MVPAVFKVSETSSGVALSGCARLRTHSDASPPAPDPLWVWEWCWFVAFLDPVLVGTLQEDYIRGLMRLRSVNALVNQRAARRRTVGRAHPGCNLGNGTAQDLDLS